MIRIINVTNSWLPQTMSWLYHSIIGLSKNKDFRVDVICSQLVNQEQYFYSKVILLKKKNLFVRAINFILSRKANPLRKALLKINLDKNVILHSHFGPRGWYDMKVAKELGVKHVVSFYGADVTQTPKTKNWAKRYHDMFATIDGVFCEGKVMAKELTKIGCPPSKIKLSKLGVDCNKIKFVPRNLLKDKAIKVLIAGTFREKKGIKYALLALEKLILEFPMIKITVIGDATNKAGDLEVKNEILTILNANKSLKSKTSLLGFVSYDELLSISYGHQVFISPSVTAKNGDTEGGAPVTIIEMLASGISVITTNHCDIPDLFPLKYRSNLCKERNTEDIVESFKKILQDSNKVELLECRKFVEENFDLKITVDSLQENYREVLGGV